MVSKTAGCCSPVVMRFLRDAICIVCSNDNNMLKGQVPFLSKAAFFAVIFCGLQLFSALTQSCSGAGAERIYQATRPATVFIRTDLILEVSFPETYIQAEQIERSVDIILQRTGIGRNHKTIADALGFALRNYPERHVLAGKEIRSIEYRTGGLGSGFIVTPEGHIVTNAHVVGYSENDIARAVLKSFSHETARNAVKTVLTSFPELRTLDDRYGEKLIEDIAFAISTVRYAYSKVGGKRLVRVAVTNPRPEVTRAKVLKIGQAYPGKDVAILKIEGTELPYLRLGDESEIGVGGEIFAIGFPGAGFQSDSMDASSLLEATITRGIISAKKHSKEKWPILQIDAAISPGNSGGPAIDPSGAVLGIATAVAKDPRTGQLVEGIHFVIPASVVKEFLRDARVAWADARPLSNVDRQLIQYCKSGKLRKVQQLVSNGGNINCQDREFGATPLHWASHHGHKELAKWLLLNGASPDSRNHDGRTPLMFAAAKGYGKIVKMLLRSGADTSIRDKQNRTALGYAKCQAHWATVKILRSGF